jgi:hypothetical protein
MCTRAVKSLRKQVHTFTPSLFIVRFNIGPPVPMCVKLSLCLKFLPYVTARTSIFILTLHITCSSQSVYSLNSTLQKYIIATSYGVDDLGTGDRVPVR